MKRILVADDSVTIQKVIALTFAAEPFEVQSVGNGAEALELMKSFVPDIVLADVIMPQMNGYELCRAVKQQAATSSIPILLLAGTFEAFDEGEAKSVGADDFITKPFESAELIEKVKALLGEGPAPAAEPLQAPSPQPAPAQPTPPQATAPAAAADPAPRAIQPAAPPAIMEAATPPVTAEAGVQEPDIWDILSDAGEDVRAPAAEPFAAGSTAGVPGFSPIGDTGVVDVGSFDVGLDRPEPTPAPEPPPVISVPEPPMPEPPVEFAASPPESFVPPVPAPPASAPPVSVPPASAPPASAPPASAPIVVEPPAMPAMDSIEKSRVEDREKDFFGFETGAVEEVSGGDFLSEAIEEVTFDMDEVSAAGLHASPEASFVVPEPVANQPQAAGETVAPGTMAPLSVPAVPPVPAPEPPVPSFDTGEMTFDAPPEPPAVPEIDLQEADLPEPGSPVEPAAASGGAGAGGLDDAAIRKIIEEKVEKIAWEVVPEMAEVFIREALEKIKGGS